MKKNSVFGLVALALLAGGNLYANDLEVSGFTRISTTLSERVQPGAVSNRELKTEAIAEVDFKKTMGKTTLRLDVEFPGNPFTAAQGISPDIEQAKFTHGLGDRLSFTGGVFNAPIKFEARDAPGLWSFSYGQIANRAPVNLAGVMFSWEGDPATFDLYFANDWRGPKTATSTPHDNSVGGRAKVKTGPANIELAYITSNRDKASPNSVTGQHDGDTLDVVLSSEAIKNTLLAFEYLTDDNHNGWGLTGNYTHGPHGVTLRYDRVENSAETTPAADDSTSLTVALLCTVWDSVRTIVEWRQDDSGVASAKKTDLLTLAWVAEF
jgi:hypothetical protein